MIIQTERLILRPFTLEDTDEYYSLISASKAIAEFVPYALTNSSDEMRKNISKCYSKGNFEDDFYLIIEEKSTQKIIGAIIAVRIKKGELDVAYLLGESFQCQGYMYEAMVGFRKALSSTKIRYLSFMIDRRNLKSRKLAEKLGAECIGINSGWNTFIHYCMEV